MYAVFVTGGKQYKAQVGDVLFIEKLEVEADSEIVFDEVLMLGKDGALEIGAPTVKGATVAAKALKNGKGKKIIVYKYKAKKNYRRKQGHRQPYTKVEVTAINA